MKLSRRVPPRSARTETLEFNWFRKDWLEMNQHFRDIRAKSKNPMDKCYWCKHPFEDGETMAIGSIKGKGNKVFCQTCAGGVQE